MKKGYLLIGEIVRPQGIRGEVKVRALSEDMDRYARLQTVYTEDAEGAPSFQVLRGRCTGDFAYLTLAGVETREAAEALRGTLLYVSREEAIPLPEGRHFICDLVGLQAEDEKGTRIGTLREVRTPNTYCDVYVFDTPRGEMQMPALKKVLLQVSPEKGKLVLDSQVLQEIALWPDTPGIVEEA